MVSGVRFVRVGREIGVGKRERYSKTSNNSIFSIINRLSIVVRRFLQVNAMGQSHDKRHHLVLQLTPN